MVYHGLSLFIMVYHLKYPSKPWKTSSFPQIFRSRRATRKRWSVWCGANTRRPCRRHRELGGSHGNLGGNQAFSMIFMIFCGGNSKLSMLHIIFHDISYESNEFGPGYLAGCFGMGEFARTRPDPDSTVDVMLSYFQTNQHLLWCLCGCEMR